MLHFLGFLPLLVLLLMLRLPRTFHSAVAASGLCRLLAFMASDLDVLCHIFFGVCAIDVFVMSF